MIAIAIQGIEGSFHDQAARAYFGEPVSIVPCERFEAVIEAVTAGRADGALMAIENSIAGTILSNYALIRDSGLHVTGEIMMRISHHVMTRERIPISDIREIRSHPMALQQCEEFLRQHPYAIRVETWDTAAAARDLRREENRSVAVIAPQQAATTYGLVILASGIESNKRNFTRFLVLRASENDGEGTRASICLKIAHRVGALARVLEILARHHVNLTKIQSTPILGREWEYWMFLDLEFPNRDVFARAMREMEPETESVRTLGIYPKGKTLL